MPFREIDFLRAGVRRLLPIEVKSHGRVSAVDGRSLEAFLKDPYRLDFLARAKMPIIPFLIVCV